MTPEPVVITANMEFHEAAPPSRRRRPRRFPPSHWRARLASMLRRFADFLNPMVTP